MRCRLHDRQDKEQQADIAQQLEAQCDWLEGQADSMGPYFMGSEFSLVDCALVPWFVRSYVLLHFRGLQLPPERCTKVCAQACSMNPVLVMSTSYRRPCAPAAP